jgi:hypothetical protein
MEGNPLPQKMNENKDETQKQGGSLSFFELRTPRDMLEKTRREYGRLADNFHIDHVFNFFITAYHIRDYIETINAVKKEELDTILEDQDIKDCKYLCNKGKHLVLTQSSNPATHIWTSTLGMAPIGILPIGCGQRWEVYIPSDCNADTNPLYRPVEIESLARRVLEKWDTFFVNHGL